MKTKLNNRPVENLSDTPFNRIILIINNLYIIIIMWFSLCVI
jgi:hypothetical protein